VLIINPLSNAVVSGNTNVLIVKVNVVLLVNPVSANVLSVATHEAALFYTVHTYNDVKADGNVIIILDVELCRE
jgi:hypothetical protein